MQADDATLISINCELNLTLRNGAIEHKLRRRAN
jgi:hypothetical protein